MQIKNYLKQSKHNQARKNNIIKYTLLFSVGFLLIIGVIAITSVSTGPAQEALGNPYYYLVRHLLYIAFGLSLGYFVSIVKLDLIKKYSLFFLILNILLFLAVWKFGFSAGGATRWLMLGPFMIQPAEFIKLTFITFFCAKLSGITEKKSKKKSKSVVFPKEILISLSLLAVILFFLYNQPDFSNMVILFIVSAIIYFLAGTPIWHVGLITALGAGCLAALVSFSSYRLDRILVFLNPEADPMGKGYQIKQALIAIGSGGIFGLGLGMSRQKMGFLPESMTDAIFAVFSEEAGFIGAVLLVFLFILFLWVGIMISKKTTDKFSSLLATGITFWIIVQAFANIGSMIQIFPLAGIALPFLSYGGSHIVAELIGIGLLFNIAKNKL